MAIGWIPIKNFIIMATKIARGSTGQADLISDGIHLGTTTPGVLHWEINNPFGGDNHGCDYTGTSYVGIPGWKLTADGQVTVAPTAYLVPSSGFFFHHPRTK